MPLYEVTLIQSYFGVRTDNRWNYQSAVMPPTVSGSFALANALGAIPDMGVYDPIRLMWAIARMQNDSVDFQALLVRDVYDPTDFYEATFVTPLTGQESGVGLSPTAAFGFRTNRTRLDIRRGTKRFVGVGESSSHTGGAILPAWLADQCAFVAQEMSSNIGYDDGGTVVAYSPVVVQRERYDVPGSDPVRHAYRYYEDPEVQAEHIMTGITWEALDFTRTQTSRQYGRGS